MDALRVRQTTFRTFDMFLDWCRIAAPPRFVKRQAGGTRDPRSTTRHRCRRTSPARSGRWLLVLLEIPSLGLCAHEQPCPGRRRAHPGCRALLESDLRTSGPAAPAPTLVLLHGAGDSAGTWSSIVKTFTPRYRVVIPDLAGHGGSAPAEGAISVGQVLEGLEAVMQQGPQDPAIIVGNSLGAWAAMLYTREHPESRRQARPGERRRARRGQAGSSACRRSRAKRPPR